MTSEGPQGTECLVLARQVLVHLISKWLASEWASCLVYHFVLSFMIWKLACPGLS